MNSTKIIVAVAAIIISVLLGWLAYAIFAAAFAPGLATVWLIIYVILGFNIASMSISCAGGGLYYAITS